MPRSCRSRRWEERLGDAHGRATGGEPARFCVLALGKLGGRELNFSSDIDLLYLYEGEGACVRGGAETSVSNEEFFTKVAETVTRALNERTEDGFLFRADVRLRPEGAIGPLVRSASELEYYYSTAGQTWERLAMIKAQARGGQPRARRGAARKPARVPVPAPSRRRASSRRSRR